MARNGPIWATFSYDMAISKGTREIKVRVPADVADFYDQQAVRYNTSVSAAASPVMCAYARGEIKRDFIQPGGNHDVSRPL